MSDGTNGPAFEITLRDQADDDAIAIMQVLNALRTVADEFQKD